MADRYLLESGAPDGYLLEDGSGVLSLESTVTVHQGSISFSGAGTFAAAAAAQLAAAWSVTGAATFAAAGRRKAAGAWAVVGAATFAAAGSRKTVGAIALQGAATFGADGVIAGAGIVHQGSVAFAGAAVLALDGIVVAPAPAPDVDLLDARVVLSRSRPPAPRTSTLTQPSSVSGAFAVTFPRPTVQLEGDVGDPVTRGAFVARLERPIAEGVGQVGDGEDTLRELVELAVAAAGGPWLAS